MEPVFNIVEYGCWPLFVGAIVAFANNSRLVDNSQELKDNVRDKHFFIDKR